VKRILAGVGQPLAIKFGDSQFRQPPCFFTTLGNHATHVRAALVIPEFVFLMTSFCVCFRVQHSIGAKNATWPQLTTSQTPRSIATISVLGYSKSPTFCESCHPVGWSAVVLRVNNYATCLENFAHQSNVVIYNLIPSSSLFTSPLFQRSVMLLTRSVRRQKSRLACTVECFFPGFCQWSLGVSIC